MSESTAQGEIPCRQPSAFIRRKFAVWLFVVGLPLAAVVAAGCSEAGSRGYTADAYLRCAIRPETLLTDASNPPPSELEFETFKNTQMSLMTNRIVLNAALHRETKVGDEKVVIAKFPMLSDQNDPTDWLAKNLSIAFPNKGEIMKVSVTTSNPVQSAAIANAVVHAYLSEVVDAERKRREERISELKGIQIGKAQEVKDAMTDLRRIADALGTTDSDAISQKQKIILDELAILRAESIRNQFEYNRMISELAAQKSLLQAAENSALSDFECEQFGASDALLKKVGEELANREVAAVAKDQAQAAEGKDQAQTDALKKKYSERIEQIRQEIKRKNMAEHEKEVKRIEAAIEIVKKQNEVAQEDLKALKKEADRIGVSSIDMQMRRTAIANAQKSLDTITAELEKLNVEAKSAPRVTLIQEAEPPRE